MDNNKLLKEIYEKISKYKNIDNSNEKIPSTLLEAFELGHGCGYICLSKQIKEIFKKHNYQG